MNTRRRWILSLLIPMMPSLCYGAVSELTVEAENTLSFARPSQTIELTAADLAPLGVDDLKRIHVRDAAGDEVLCQAVDTDFDAYRRPDIVIFQADFGAGETRTFKVAGGNAQAYARDQFKAFGRFVRERFDDFAWENDRIAHRTYGRALETWEGEPLSSSTIDVWCKRTPRLVINDWYLADDYHADHGEGGDFYSAGPTRGCGGNGLWASDRLWVSRTFVDSRVLANGPIRVLFELVYEPFAVDGTSVSEVKRISLDAGQQLGRFESRYKPFTRPGRERPLVSGAGLKKVSGETVEFNGDEGWLAKWEGVSQNQGSEGLALIADPDVLDRRAEDDLNHLLLINTSPDYVVSYWAGFCWDQAGHIADFDGWKGYVSAFAKGLRTPIRVTLTAVAANRPPVVSRHQEINGATPLEWSVRLADSQLARLGDTLSWTEDGEAKWTYTTGLFTFALLRLDDLLDDTGYGDYTAATLDSFLAPDGSIRRYKREDYNIDNINPGRSLLALWQRTGEGRYKQAADVLRDQLREHPRTSEGGFWHKKRYPTQMWLDGIYMGSPFYAEYGKLFDEPENFDDVAKQVRLIRKHAYDPDAGLFYHGWDESRNTEWANPDTGTSSNFWGRGLGWFSMALVDVLDYFPDDHPARAEIVGVLNTVCEGVVKVQDPKSGLWWQVLDQGGHEGNYLEATASSMFAYTLAKAINQGYISSRYLAPTVNAYRAIVRDLIREGEDGRLSLTQCCSVAGLGYGRDGSYAYYLSEPIVDNDPKGVGPFILAGIELQKLMGLPMTVRSKATDSSVDGTTTK